MILSRADWPAMREKLEALFASSFGRPVAPGYLDWRYHDNGHSDLLFSLEMDGAEPVASYSVAPVTLAADGVTCRTALSMTTMTHPGWRGRGLFPRLAAELYAHAEAHRISAVWGFPNANSHPHFVGKLRWSDIYEIPTLTLDLVRADEGKMAASPAVERDDSFALTYPAVPRDGLVRVRRTRDYLAWRYAQHPLNCYQNHVLAADGVASSYVVTKHYSGGLDIVDIQCATPDEARVLLAHVAAAGRGQALRQLHCWAPAHHWVHAVLERLGFENTAPVTYFGGRDLVPNAAPAGWLDHRNWYFQMGDSDVY